MPARALRHQRAHAGVPWGIAVSVHGSALVVDNVATDSPFSADLASGDTVEKINGHSALSPAASSALKTALSIQLDVASHLFVPEPQSEYLPGDATSVITNSAVVVGTGQSLMPSPHGVVYHPVTGDTYISGGSCICKVSADGVISDVAGKSVGGTGARFRKCRGISLSPHLDSLLLCDSESHCVFRVHLQSLEVVLVCGTGVPGGTDGPIATATFDGPHQAIETSGGDIFVMCSDACTIRRVDASGSVTTFAGQHGVGGNLDGPGGSATFDRPFQMEYFDDTLFVADNNSNKIRQISIHDENAAVSTLPFEADSCTSITAAHDSQGRLCLVVNCSASLVLFYLDGIWRKTVLFGWADVDCQIGFHSALTSDGERLVIAFRTDHVVKSVKMPFKLLPVYLRRSIPHQDSVLYHLVRDGFSADTVGAHLSALSSAAALSQLQYNTGITALHIAAGAGSHPPNSSVLSILLSHKMDVNQHDATDRTPIFYSAGVRHKACGLCCKLLCEHGADPCSTDSEGYALIHLAAGALQPADAGAMCVLSEMGADLQQVDPLGRTVFQYGASGSETASVSDYKAPFEKPCCEMLVRSFRPLEEKLSTHGSLNPEEEKTFGTLFKICEHFFATEKSNAASQIDVLRGVVEHYDAQFRAPYTQQLCAIRNDSEYGAFTEAVHSIQSVCAARTEAVPFFRDGSMHQVGLSVEMCGRSVGEPHFPTMGTYLQTDSDQTCTDRPIYKTVKGDKALWYCDGAWKVGKTTMSTSTKSFFEMNSCAFTPSDEAAQVWQSKGDPPVPVQGVYCRSFSLLDSFRNAFTVQPLFDKLMSTLSAKTGGNWLTAKRKGLFRTIEKASTFKGPTKFFGETVSDLVRGGLQFDRMATQLMCLRLLCALDAGLVEKDDALKAFVPALQGAERDLGLHILDLKNRYASPTSAGWADCCVRLYFEQDPNRHIVEIQLVHEDLFRCRARLGAHTAYSKSRAASELLEVLGHSVNAHETSRPNLTRMLSQKHTSEDSKSRLEEIRAECKIENFALSELIRMQTLQIEELKVQLQGLEDREPCEQPDTGSFSDLSCIMAGWQRLWPAGR